MKSIVGTSVGHGYGPQHLHFAFVRTSERIEHGSRSAYEHRPVESLNS